MFDITPDPKGFVRLTISGKITPEEMQAGLEAFLGSLEDGKKTNFLYTISDIEFPAIGALGVEFSYIPLLLTSLSKIGKVAVIADQAWLRTAAEVEGKVIPGLTVRSFELGAPGDAEKWLLEAA